MSSAPETLGSRTALYSLTMTQPARQALLVALGIFLLLASSTVGCRGGSDGDGDTDADSDSEGDADVDGNGDADVDSDSDSDVDSEADADPDGDDDADVEEDDDADPDGDDDADLDVDPDRDVIDCSEVARPCESEGDRRCSATLRDVEACERDDDGCLAWTLVETCGARQVCGEGELGPGCVCENECDTDGATRCVGEVVTTCVSDGDGCRFLEAGRDCSEIGMVCDDVSGEAECVEDVGGCGDGICDPDEDAHSCPDDCDCLRTFRCEAEEEDFECGVETALGRRYPDRGSPWCSDVLSREDCNCDLMRCVSSAPLCPGDYVATFRERMIAGCSGVAGRLDGTCDALWNVIETWPGRGLVAERRLLNVSLDFDWAEYDLEFTIERRTRVRIVVEQDAWFEDVSGSGNAGRSEVDWAEIAPRSEGGE